MSRDSGSPKQPAGSSKPEEGVTIDNNAPKTDTTEEKENSLKKS
tara:strand:- start:39 stop:170 length:132 start_codon:yes stop_codon:yes gene_type:complete